MTAKLLQVIKTGDILGEGPVWNPRDQRLWWTDIQSRRLRQLDPASGVITDLAMPERVGSFAFVAGQPQVLLAAFETGLGFFNLESGAVDWITRSELGAGRRFNDGRTDRQGRFWAGSMVEHEAIAGPASAALWRVDAQGQACIAETGVQISNGLAFSLDGRRMYFADSPHQQICAFDLDPDTGEISNRRGFAQVERGHPDGAAVDAEDCLWSARWGAGEVVRHAPDGREIEVVKVPAEMPTCVAFGGPNLSLMFVTSSSDELTEAERLVQPSAGDLFIYDCAVCGLPEVEFQPMAIQPH